MKEETLRELLAENADHSIYMHCRVCHMWGIPMLGDEECGNCGKKEDITMYFPEESISKLFSTLQDQHAKERREEMEKLITEIRDSYPDWLYDVEPAGDDVPDDPLLAADQATLSAINKIVALLKSRI